MVIVYRVSPLTYIAGRMFIKVKSIGMVNLIAGGNVAPELIQGDANGPRIAEEAGKLLTDRTLRSTVKAELTRVRKALGTPGASARAAGIFLDMLNKAEERGFKPEFVLFDTRYSSIKNLKAIRKKGWHWLTRLKKNRLVNPDNTGNVTIEMLNIPLNGMKVHLKEYGFIKVFRIVSEDEDTQYWATDVLDMQEEKRKELAKKAWKIEEYHRGIKQFCGVERCQARRNNVQRAHIMMALRAFLRFEIQRIRTGITWFETKWSITRNAVNQFIRNPIYTLV